MSSPSWLTARNSLQTNPVASDITTNSHGADFAWAVMSVQLVVFVGHSLWTFFCVNRGNRAFNYLYAAVLACNALSWYAMASNLGAVPVTVEWYQGGWAGRGSGIDGKATRSIWIPRYIDWLISTPFVIIAALLATPVPLSTIFMTVFIETITVTCALAGALTPSQYKWGWFVIGMCGLSWVCWVFFGPGLLAAKKAGGDVFWAYLPQVIGFGLWLIPYVICWSVSDASNLISPDAELIYYGVLDLITKSLCFTYYVFITRGVDYERFGLFSSKASIFASSQQPGQAANEPADNNVGLSKQEKDTEQSDNANNEPEQAGNEA